MYINSDYYFKNERILSGGKLDKEYYALRNEFFIWSMKQDLFNKFSNKQAQKIRKSNGKV